MSTVRIGDRVAQLERQVAHLEAKLPVIQPAAHMARQQAPGLAELLGMVAEAFGVTLVAMRGPARVQPLPQARHAYAWLAHRVTGASLNQVGQALGDRDHSTIYHGRLQAEALRQTSPRFLALTDALLAQARGRA